MKRFVLVSAALVALLSSPPLCAQQGTQAQEVYRILGISVEGNSLADPSAVIANSGLRVGDELTVPGEALPQAIRKLWSLKIFDDIQIAIDRKAGDGVFLLIRVKELPRLESSLVEGNDELDEEDILKKITLVRGQVVSPAELRRFEKEIMKLYEADGYMLAKVKITTEPADTSKGRVNIRVTVDEGPEVQVASIEFEGNTVFDDGDLRGEMDETSEKSWWKFWSSAQFDRKKYEEDKQLIVKHYRRNGFRDAEVMSDSIRYSDDREEMSILIRVYEGPQYHIRAITWEGNTVYPDDVLSERLGMLPGDVYDMEKFEQNLRGNEEQSDVSSLYLDNGYLRFNLDPREVRVGEAEMDIAIRVYEMNQFRVGQVNIAGNNKTWEKVIRRELYTRPGDYFSRGAIIRSIRQLSVLNYFNPEKIKPETQLVDDKTVDLTFNVEEKSSDNINASVGYSGAYGVTGALGFTLNNFSISQPLRGGAGQILSFEWQFGEASRFRTFSVGFTEPWLFDTPTLFGVSAFDTRQIYTYDLRQYGGSVKVGRRFRWPDDYFRGDWILTALQNDIKRGMGIYVEGKTSQVSLTQIISRNSLDNPIFPSQGSNVSASIEMSGGPLLPGDVDFTKWMFDMQWFIPMFGTNRVSLFVGAQYGWLSPFYANSVIPPIELFFMGGTGLGYINTTPLRGYPDQSIGPRNANGSITGGRAFAKTVAELRFTLAMNPVPILVLGFAEQGNVYESMSTADFMSMYRSAGFGARLQIMPIGLIGFDYGYGFDDVYPRDGRPDGWRFHFVFGRGF